MPGLSARDLCVSYDDSTGRSVKALDRLSLQVDEGEIAALVGPSGAGKSTFLRVMAGLLAPQSGSAEVGGQAPRLGRVGLMAQEDLLLPWRSVLDNAAFGLALRGTPWGEARKAAGEALTRFGMGEFLQSWPSELSGGMKQRVSFLRTVLAGQDVVLLDEPFGSLDAITRWDLHRWFLAVWEEFRPTVLLVTHDVEEAIFLSDRIFTVSGRPARLTREVVVPFGRPRDLASMERPEAISLKGELLRGLLEERS